MFSLLQLRSSIFSAIRAVISNTRNKALSLDLRHLEAGLSIYSTRTFRPRWFIAVLLRFLLGPVVYTATSGPAKRFVEGLLVKSPYSRAKCTQAYAATTISSAVASLVFTPQGKA